jgi:hypothetical protein
VHTGDLATRPELLDRATVDLRDVGDVHSSSRSECARSGT